MAPNLDEMTGRIAGILDSATDSEWQEGTYWYATAHSAAVALASEYGKPVETVAGVIAALSPRLPWQRNIEYAARMMATGSAPVLLGNLSKAKRIWQGEHPLDVLSGPKVRAFYADILMPGVSLEVCIDRHAVDAALGLKGTDESRKRILERKGGYEMVAQAYRNVADRYAISPMQCQAIVWVAWRNGYANKRG